MASDELPTPTVGQSITSRGEDIARTEDEPGHDDHGTSGADRPAGEASARASSAVNPQDPVDPQSPKLITP